MEKVTTDNLTGYDWFYEDGWFIQKDPEGKLISQLSLKNIPNPYTLWEGRIKKSENVVMRPLTNEERQRAKPGEYMFTLWDYKTALES